MNANDVKKILNQYFEGETTLEQEKNIIRLFLISALSMKSCSPLKNYLPTTMMIVVEIAMCVFTLKINSDLILGIQLLPVSH